MSCCMLQSDGYFLPVTCLHWQGLIIASRVVILDLFGVHQRHSQSDPCKEACRGFYPRPILTMCLVCYARLTWFLGGAGLTKQKGRELLLLLPMQPVRGKEGTKPEYWSYFAMHTCISLHAFQVYDLSCGLSPCLHSHELSYTYNSSVP